jgi:hypothetical protein
MTLKSSFRNRRMRVGWTEAGEFREVTGGQKAWKNILIDLHNGRRVEEIKVVLPLFEMTCTHGEWRGDAILVATQTL